MCHSATAIQLSAPAARFPPRCPNRCEWQRCVGERRGAVNRRAARMLVSDCRRANSSWRTQRTVGSREPERVSEPPPAPKVQLRGLVQQSLRPELRHPRRTRRSSETCSLADALGPGTRSGGRPPWRSMQPRPRFWSDPPVGDVDVSKPAPSGRAPPAALLHLGNSFVHRPVGSCAAVLGVPKRPGPSPITGLVTVSARTAILVDLLTAAEAEHLAHDLVTSWVTQRYGVGGLRASRPDPAGRTVHA